MYMLMKLNNDPEGNLQQEFYCEVSGFVFHSRRQMAPTQK